MTSCGSTFPGAVVKRRKGTKSKKRASWRKVSCFVSFADMAFQYWWNGGNKFFALSCSWANNAAMEKKRVFVRTCVSPHGGHHLVLLIFASACAFLLAGN